jgi:hypothetical protein
VEHETGRPPSCRGVADRETQKGPAAWRWRLRARLLKLLPPPTARTAACHAHHPHMHPDKRNDQHRQPHQQTDACMHAPVLFPVSCTLSCLAYLYVHHSIAFT